MIRLHVIERHTLSDGSIVRVTRLGQKYNFHHYGGSMSQSEDVSQITKAEAMKLLEDTLKNDVLEVNE